MANIKKATAVLAAIAICFCHASLAAVNMVSAQPIDAAGAMISGLVSPDTTVADMVDAGIAEIQRTGGITGQGISVALIDTGVDPSVLRSDSIVTWLDMTNEGYVSTGQPTQADSKGYIQYGGTSLNVTGVPSKSGLYRAGFWSVDNLSQSSPAWPFLRSLGKIGLVVTDRYFAGQYDTVYVDTNADGVFGDEQPMEVFASSRGFSVIRGRGTTDVKLTVVVAEISNNGAGIKLGFDSHGHGTQLASMISGQHASLTPIAPQASLAVIKAVDSTGFATWSRIVDAVARACRDGADVILIGASPGVGPDADSRRGLGQVLANNRTSVVVVPAGNQGPGVGTLPLYGSYDNLLVVGGYIPASVANAQGFGHRTFFYPWSSVGPDSEGNLPDFLAPAMASVLRPQWAATRSPVLMEGTSVSAAYAAGATALVMSKIRLERVPVDGRVKRAFAETAQPLSGVTAAEQGYGAMRADRALEMALTLPSPAKTRVVFQWEGGFSEGAFFRRGQVPGRIPATLDNLSPMAFDLFIEGPSWVTHPYEVLGVPPVDQRSVLFDLSVSNPGLYSGRVFADDPARRGYEASAALTVIVPHSAKSGSFGLESLLAAGDLRREFIEVPQGLGLLDIVLSVAGPSGRPRGRARLYVYDGTGCCVYSGPWLGAGADMFSDNVRFELPQPGVWEVVILSDPAVGSYGQDDTEFRLTVRPGGLLPLDIAPTPVLNSGQRDMVTQVSLLNRGGTFRAEAEILIDGYNGFLRRGTTTTTPGVSAVISMPRVERGTEWLEIIVSFPSVSSARAMVYVYMLDEELGQWKQVDQAEAKTQTAGRVHIVDPRPGQYVAYVDITGNELGTSFSWLVAAARDLEGVAIAEAVSGTNAFDWGTGAVKTLESRVSSNVASMEGSRYIVVRDRSMGLVSVNPMTIAPTTNRPLVSVSPGASDANAMNLTLCVWSSSTFEPMNACIGINGVWYQTIGGKATIAVPRKRIEQLVIHAEDTLLLYPTLIEPS